MQVLHRKKAVYTKRVLCFKKAHITQELKGAELLSKHENECEVFPFGIKMRNPSGYEGLVDSEHVFPWGEVREETATWKGHMRKSDIISDVLSVV